MFIVLVWSQKTTLWSRFLFFGFECHIRNISLIQSQNYLLLCFLLRAFITVFHIYVFNLLEIYFSI